VLRQFLHQPQAKDRLAPGVVEDVQFDEAQEEIA